VPLEPLRIKLAEARDALARDEIAPAAARLEEIRVELHRWIPTALAQWRQRATTLAHALSKPARALPESVVPVLEEAGEDLAPRIQQVRALGPNDDLAAIAEVIASVDAVDRSFSAVVSQYRFWLSNAFREFNATLRQVPLPAADQIDALKEILSTIDDALARRESTPTASAELVAPEDIVKLVAAWTKAVVSQIPGADPDVTKSVNEHMANGSYALAASEVVAAIRARAAKEGRILGTRPKDATADHVSAGKRVWLPSGARRADGAADGGVAVLRLPEVIPVSRLKAATLSQLLANTVLWWLGLGSLIVLAGFLIFHKTFVGNFNDLIAVFLWGYTLDVSANSAVDVAKQAKTSR
jgi:hypothetical protein